MRMMLQVRPIQSSLSARLLSILKAIAIAVAFTIAIAVVQILFPKVSFGYSIEPPNGDGSNYDLALADYEERIGVAEWCSNHSNANSNQYVSIYSRYERSMDIGMFPENNGDYWGAYIRTTRRNF